jgi:hypothetical protein
VTELSSGTLIVESNVEGEYEEALVFQAVPKVTWFSFKETRPGIGPSPTSPEPLFACIEPIGSSNLENQLHPVRATWMLETKQSRR